MSAVSLRLPDEVSSRLELLAKTTGRTKTFYMVEAICSHIEEIEDLYLAEKRRTENRAGRSKSYSLDDVEKELGLVG